MVLALQALRKFDRDRAKRGQELRSEAVRLVRELDFEEAEALIERAEDERMRGAWKQAVERLRQEG